MCIGYLSAYLTVSLQTQPLAYLGLGFHIWDQPGNGGWGGGAFCSIAGLGFKEELENVFGWFLSPNADYIPVWQA